MDIVTFTYEGDSGLGISEGWGGNGCSEGFGGLRVIDGGTSI